MNLYPYEAKEWSEKHFSGAKLSDQRRVERAIKIGAAIARKPGASIPQLFRNKYEVKAAYTFFGVEEITADNLQAGHRKLVMDRLQEAGCYVYVLDHRRNKGE